MHTVCIMFLWHSWMCPSCSSSQEASRSVPRRSRRTSQWRDCTSARWSLKQRLWYSIVHSWSHHRRRTTRNWMRLRISCQRANCSFNRYMYTYTLWQRNATYSGICVPVVQNELKCLFCNVYSISISDADAVQGESGIVVLYMVLDTLLFCADSTKQRWSQCQNQWRRSSQRRVIYRSRLISSMRTVPGSRLKVSELVSLTALLSLMFSFHCCRHLHI